jgi:ribonuclease HI
MIYSDSKYVVDAIEKRWLWGWQKKGFAKVKNPDLWQRFLKVFNQHQVKFIWVKGHAGNIENERCDQLAVQSATGPHLLIDEGYEAGEAGLNL